MAVAALLVERIGHQIDRLACGDDGAVDALRSALAEIASTLSERFRGGAPVRELVAARSLAIDRLLTAAWRGVAGLEGSAATLVAVGGYGRGELQPASDIDLLILLPAGGQDPLAGRVEPLVRLLWDSGLEVGSAVRSVDETVALAREEVTVITNLIESRRVCGASEPFERLRSLITPDRMWPSDRFFAAKIEEQRARHRRFGDTAYNLEPNLKECPGGLRDLATIGWVAKRHFGVTTFHDLVDHRFLTETEYGELMACEEFLWRLRCALHALTGRHDDRLLLDHQRTLAERLDYRDQDGRMAVEHLMHDYYRTVMALSRLNEMLLQLFSEELLCADPDAEPRALTQHFQARNGFLEVINPPLFTYRPFSLLEVYLLLAQNPDLTGVRASTLRLMRAHLHLIDERFRRDRRAHDYFIQLLRQPHGVTRALRRMHRHGVLAAYLPPFARIEGQMQFDLFHTYTVDQHTLFVLRNTRHLFTPESQAELPLATQVARTLPKPELLHIAALFHDIAKGRGGDHSTLGEQEVIDFAARHSLGEWDQRLVGWLVRNHLAMSSTAQRRDIDDPAVIHEFALLVGDPVRLDYLYLLTVCDIRATNPQLWNSWRESLLRGLYQSTKRALRRGLGNPIDRDERVVQVRTAALSQLEADQLPLAVIESVWSEFDDDYFMRHTPSEVAWHTAIIAARQRLPLVEMRHEHERGTTAIFIHADESQYLFGHTTALLEQLGLSVVDARIIQSTGGHTLDTYLVMESDGEPIGHGYRSEEIRAALLKRLADPGHPLSPPERCLPRRHKHIPVSTEIHLHYDPRRHCTALELYTRDRPGLLSRIALAFACSSVRLLNAKIGTFGSHVEDLFYITDDAHQPVAEGEASERLIASLHHFLADDGNDSAARTGTGGE